MQAPAPLINAFQSDVSDVLTPLPYVIPSPPTICAQPPQHDEADGEASTFPGLVQWLEELSLDPAAPRFRGESSSHGIVDFENNLSQQLHDQAAGLAISGEQIKRRTEFWQTQPVRTMIRGPGPQLIQLQWERQGLEASGVCECHRTFEFPPSDLLWVLIEKYFEETNTLLPLLYRPGFERFVKDGLHLRDHGFASVLFCVCALAAPFVDDPRVLLEGSPLSSGWKYFHQVQLSRKSLLAPPTLFDVQVCCVRPRLDIGL